MSLTDTLLFLNHKQIKPAELPIIPADELGLSIFETMQSKGGRILHLSEHLDRLLESAKSAGVQLPESREKIEKTLLEIAKQNPNHSIRLTILGKYMFTMVSERRYSQETYQAGVDLLTSTVRRNHTNSVPPEVKSGEFTNGILGILDSNLEGIFDRLYLGADGYVREGGIWNFFMVKDAVLKTPPTAGILHGVVRRFVLKYASQLGILLEETFFTRHDVFNADEAFLTNSTGLIVPVRSLDGRRIGSKVPGTITQKLIQKFKQNGQN